MPPVHAKLAARLLVEAPDPFGDGSRPQTASQWQVGLSAAGIEGAAGDLATEGGFVRSADERAGAARSAAAAQMEAGFQAACAAEALAALQSAGIVSAQLKGTGLAQRVYPPGWVRRATDVDLIVWPANFDAALGALATLGYTPMLPERDAFYRRHHHDVPLRRDFSPTLDLHQAALAGLGTIVLADELLRANGTLDPLAEIVYLAAHGAGHLFERPLWVLDIALAVGAAGHPDLPLLDAIAERWHLRRAWRLARLVVHRQLGAQALPWPAPEPSRADDLALNLRASYLRLPAHSARRFAAYAAGSWAHCDTPLRAAWMAQFGVLRAAGDLVRNRGLPVPADWPPLKGRPQ